MLPGGLDYCPMEQVLTFRERFSEHRAAFRETISSLAAELTRIEDEAHAHELLQEFKDKLSTRNERIAKDAKQLFGEFKYSALSVGVPTAIGAISLAGTDHITPRNVGAGVIVGAVASLCDAAKTVRKQWKTSEQFYYLRLNAHFGGKHALSLDPLNYESIMHEFMDD
jgi:hypothetical protein